MFSVEKRGCTWFILTTSSHVSGRSGRLFTFIHASLVVFRTNTPLPRPACGPTVPILHLRHLAGTRIQGKLAWIEQQAEPQILCDWCNREKGGERREGQGLVLTAVDSEWWVTSPETKLNETKDLSTKANVWWKGRKMGFLWVFHLDVTLQMWSGETKCFCGRNAKERASWTDEQAETRKRSAVKCGGLFHSCQRWSSDSQEGAKS